MKVLKYSLLFSLAACVAPQAMACFTVYNASSQVVYSGLTPPIDMSYQIHERLPAVFPGGHMVFGMDTDCPSIDLRRTAGFSNVSVASATPRTGRAPRADRQ